MSRQFPDAADKAAMVEAVQRVEARSGAEIVVVVRARSGSYLHADLLLGVAFGCATPTSTRSRCARGAAAAHRRPAAARARLWHNPDSRRGGDEWA